MQPGPFANQAWSIIDILAPYAGNLMLHSTLLVTAGLLLSRLLKRQSAVLQSLVLRTFLAAVLLSPVITLVVQSAGVHGIMLDIPRVAPADTAQLSLSSPNEEVLAATAGSRTPSAPFRIAEPVAGHDRTFNISILFGMNYRRTFFTVLITVWLILSTLFLLKLISNYIRVVYLRYHAEDASWEDIRTCREVAHELEVDAPIVLKSPLIGGPFLTGITHPAIILPADSVVSREIIYHEIAHLARRDCIWNILAMLGIVLIPFQPLMHILAHRIENLSDYVCDDYVLECRGNRKTYAYQLLDLAERYHQQLQYPIVSAGAVKSKSELRHRIERLLRQQRVRIANGLRAVLVVTGAAVILGFTVGSVYFNNRPHRAISAFFSVLSFEMVMNPELPESIASMLDMEKAAMEEVPVAAPIVLAVPEPADEPEEIPVDITERRVVMASLEDRLPVEPAVEEIPVEEDVVEQQDEHITSIRRLIEEQAEPLTFEKVFERLDITEEDINTYEACVTLGKQQFLMRKYCLAEKIFEWGLIHFDMNDPDITNLLGEVYLAKGEIDLARYYFKKAIILDSNRAEFHYNLGKVYWAMGRTLDAMSKVGEATQMNPSFTNKGKY